MSSQVYYIIVVGGFQSGKTEFIRAFSDFVDLDAIPGGQSNFYDEGIISVGRKISNNEVTLTFGRISVDPTLLVYLVEIPPVVRFDLILFEEEALILGFIIILDSTRPEEFGLDKFVIEAHRQFYDYFELPYVVVANKQDHPNAWSMEDLKIVWRIKEDEKFLFCNAKNKESVKNVLLEFLYQVTTVLPRGKAS